MKRILLTLACLLCLAGLGHAAPDFIIGDSVTPGGTYLNGQGDHIVYDTSIYQHVASSGDQLTKLLMFFRGNSGSELCTAIVAIYAWNVAGDSATSRLYLDTIFGTHSDNSGGGYESLTVAQGNMTTISLAAGTRYTIAAGDLGSTTMATGFVDGASGTISRERNTENPGSYLPDPYDWSPVPDASLHLFYLWAWGVNGTLDTCSVTHTSTTAIDTGTATIQVRDAYTDNASAHDSVSLIWDDDTNPAGPLGRASATSGVTNPDTLTATGLTDCTTYYLWFIVTPKGCAPDTSAMLTIPTDCIPSHRTIIGS